MSTLRWKTYLYEYVFEQNRVAVVSCRFSSNSRFSTCDADTRDITRGIASVQSQEEDVRSTFQVDTSGQAIVFVGRIRFFFKVLYPIVETHGDTSPDVVIPTTNTVRHESLLSTNSWCCANLLAPTITWFSSVRASSTSIRKDFDSEVSSFVFYLQKFIYCKVLLCWLFLACVL